MKEMRIRLEDGYGRLGDTVYAVYPEPDEKDIEEGKLCVLPEEYGHGYAGNVAVEKQYSYSHLTWPDGEDIFLEYVFLDERRAKMYAALKRD
jgi:hypothetical protein